MPGLKYCWCQCPYIVQSAPYICIYCSAKVKDHPIFWWNLLMAVLPYVNFCVDTQDYTHWLQCSLALSSWKEFTVLAVYWLFGWVKKTRYNSWKWEVFKSTHKSVWCVLTGKCAFVTLFVTYSQYVFWTTYFFVMILRRCWKVQ